MRISRPKASLNTGIRDFQITFTSKLFLVFISLGTQSILAWILGPEGRGAYAVCVLFTMILGMVFIVGCDYAGIYFLAAKKLSVSEGVIYTLLFGIVGSILAVGVGLIIMTLPVPFLTKASTTQFQLSLVLIPVSVFSYTLLQLLTAIRQFGWFSIFSVITSFAQLLFTALFVFIMGCGVTGALFANISSASVSMLLTLSFLHSKYILKWPKISFQKLWDMFFYDIRHYVGKISNQINFEIGIFILALFATPREIGLFSVAVAIMMSLNIIPNTLENILIPRVAADPLGRPRLIIQIARMTGIVCAIILIILFLFADIIITIIFSPAFLPVVTLIRIMIPAILIRCTSKILVTYLIGKNNPGLVSISVAAGVITNFLLLYLLLPIHGIVGAAIAMAMSFIISSVFVLFFFLKNSGLNYLMLFRFKSQDWVEIIELVKKPRKIFSTNL